MMGQVKANRSHVQTWAGSHQKIDSEKQENKSQKKQFLKKKVLKNVSPKKQNHR